MEDNMFYVDYPLGSSVILIQYETTYSKGKMMILESRYNKLINKIQKKLKDCQITKLFQAILTEELCKQYEEWN